MTEEERKGRQVELGEDEREIREEEARVQKKVEKGTSSATEEAVQDQRRRRTN